MSTTSNSRPTIVVTGANGMLGSMLMHVLPQELSGYSVLGATREELDITAVSSIEEYISAHTPTWIINTAAYTAVDDCEENREQAELVNGVAVGNLAEIAAKYNSALIHVSTDYVFNGQLESGYSEDDKRDPINAYGRSKALGEVAIEHIAEAQPNWKYYIARTAWLYGPNGANFVDTMISLGKTRDTLQVVNDQHGSPTYTKDLAMHLVNIITQQPERGVYHTTSSGQCTWFELASEIFSYSHMPVTVLPCTSAEFPRPAKRPRYSFLQNHKLPQTRDWKLALHEYLDTLPR